MVSTKGYWDMINEHIINSDLEYLETKNIEEKTPPTKSIFEKFTEKLKTFLENAD